MHASNDIKQQVVVVQLYMLAKSPSGPCFVSLADDKITKDARRSFVPITARDFWLYSALHMF